jgi:hypothetical protein
LRHASHARHSLDKQHTQSTDTILSNNKTSTSCDDNNKDKNYHLHFDKKLKAGCVVVVPFASLTIDSQVKSKEQKERDVSFILGQRSLILQTPSQRNSITLIQTSIGLMTSQICSILTNDSPPLVELVKVLQVQNILKLYHTNQDYTIVNNCLLENSRHLWYNFYGRFHWECTQKY